MATIAISLCGEGRGHATRIATLIEHLERRHDVRVYCSDDGYRFLRQRFPVGHPRVSVHEIPGIVFQYSGGRLDVPSIFCWPMSLTLCPGPCVGMPG
ncbi:MAG: hypothetical protein EBS83_01235 [Planctomycetia bacterium]|nr:hypothetical protein [Planctomycetia bacterium]